MEYKQGDVVYIRATVRKLDHTRGKNYCQVATMDDITWIQEDDIVSLIHAAHWLRFGRWYRPGDVVLMRGVVDHVSPYTHKITVTLCEELSLQGRVLVAWYEITATTPTPPIQNGLWYRIKDHPELGLVIVERGPDVNGMCYIANVQGDRGDIHQDKLTWLGHRR